MEACSLGLEQPAREGARDTTVQGTVLPFALEFTHKAPLPLLLEDPKECLMWTAQPNCSFGNSYLSSKSYLLFQLFRFADFPSTVLIQVYCSVLLFLA